MEVKFERLFNKLKKDLITNFNLCIGQEKEEVVRQVLYLVSYFHPDNKCLKLKESEEPEFLSFQEKVQEVLGEDYEKFEALWRDKRAEN